VEIVFEAHNAVFVAADGGGDDDDVEEDADG
jgi:hypothetical protein